MSSKEWQVTCSQSDNNLSPKLFQLTFLASPPPAKVWLKQVALTCKSKIYLKVEFIDFVSSSIYDTV